MLKVKFIQLSLTFITVVVIAGLFFLGYLYEITGLLTWPGNMHQVVSDLSRMGNIKVTIKAPPDVFHTSTPAAINEIIPSNLAQSPVVTPTPAMTNTSIPTFTPVSPLEPIIYETAVVNQLRIFANSLNHWLDLNQMLLEESSRFNNQRWQEEMRQTLDEVQINSESLAKIGPPPQNYQQIDALLDSAALETYNLVENYHYALDQNDIAYIMKSGLNFSNLKDILTKVAKEMIAQGWNLD